MPYVVIEAHKGEMPLSGSPKCIDIGGWQSSEMSMSRLMSSRENVSLYNNGDRHESEMLSVRAGKRMDERPCHNPSETKVFTPTAGKTARCPITRLSINLQ